MNKFDLSKLRSNEREYKLTKIPGLDISIALSALNNKEILKAKENAINHIGDTNLDENTKELILNMFILKEAIRNPDKLEEKILTFEDINEYMDPYAVYELSEQYMEVQSRKIVEFNSLSVDEFDLIKKNLNRMQLKDLDGELQKNLMYFLQMLLLKGLVKDN